MPLATSPSSFSSKDGMLRFRRTRHRLHRVRRSTTPRPSSRRRSWSPTGLGYRLRRFTVGAGVPAANTAGLDVVVVIGPDLAGNGFPATTAPSATTATTATTGRTG